MPRFIRPLLLVSALLLGAAPVVAQALTGYVLQADDRHPVEAALLQLLAPERDSILVSVITTEQGKFRVAQLPAGRYRVRILRIGFRPWTSEPMGLAGGDRDEPVFYVPAVPVVLSDITVETKSQCRGSPADDQRLALLWDDARTALALLKASSPAQMLEFRSTLVKRMVDPGDHLVSENSMLAFGRGAWPIASQPAESLARHGFVQPRDSLSGPIYYGPDVEVFFSDAFIQTHCFRLVASPDTGLIGLGFEPVKDQKLADVEGALWVDRASNRLRRMEYRYTSLWKWVPKGSAGGRLDFGFIAGGRPVLTGWSIRAPVARVVDWPEGTRVRDETTRPFFGYGKVILHGFREEVGEVRDVRTAGGEVLWARPVSTDRSSATPITSHGAQSP